MKRLLCGILVGGFLLLGIANPGLAWRGGGFHGHGHHHGHAFVRGGIVVGAPFWWWGPAYPYGYYADPPVVVQEPAPAYIAPSAPPPAPTYWYYCQQSQAYYPYVKECPGGWMTVVPPTAPPTP